MFRRWYSGFVGWSSLVRLRHVTSGLYLAVIGDENGKNNFSKSLFDNFTRYSRSKSNVHIEEECKCYCRNLRNENVESMCEGIDGRV